MNIHLAHFLVHFEWAPSFLIASVLSPTDPVFVSVIFDVKAVPERLKRLLNVESGLNDGLALPIVMLLLPFIGGQVQSLLAIAVNLLLGLAIGVAIPALGITLERSRYFEAVGLFQPLNAFAIGLLVLAVSLETGANLFLAAFAAGASVAAFSQTVREAFGRFGALLAELLKLAALLIFGELLAPRFFIPLSGSEYLFVVLAVFGVRLPAMWIALIRTDLNFQEKLAAGWFGPKGFASVVYGLMVFNLGTPEATHMAHLIALSIAGSIVVYSSTDILVGRWFHASAARKSPEDREQGAV